MRWMWSYDHERSDMVLGVAHQKGAEMNEVTAYLGLTTSRICERVCAAIPAHPTLALAGRLAVAYRCPSFFAWESGVPVCLDIFFIWRAGREGARGAN